MIKKKIGICSYGRNDQNAFHIPAEYIEAILRADAQPYILPPGEKDIAEWVKPFDGVILSGGGDINPKVYNEEPTQPPPSNLTLGLTFAPASINNRAISILGLNTAAQAKGAKSFSV